ncbi:uncharacterized protein LOC126800948 [Argentina anserina]|uniref:uncharacterized protein LOC126800948 n=1 Tax=Argentina anserina TaxID=57926 RepID=UPI0021766032|nr:uncharacterized protein LOC126800948 [Potentilla anserina]
MDEIINGKNRFFFFLDHDQLERDHPELLDPNVTAAVEVKFISKVRRYVFNHYSFHTVNPNSEPEPLPVDTTTSKCRFQDYRKVSSLRKILSKRLSEANPIITPGTNLHNEIVNEIVTAVNRFSFPALYKRLTVEVNMSLWILDRCECEECRAIRESVLMAEREAEKLIVPASESSIKKLLKRVRVAASSGLEEHHKDCQRKRRKTSSGINSSTVRPSDSDDCTICSDEFTAGKYAAQMPCLHSFHTPCIEKWLRLSHYCPICRYEMPVADDQADEKTFLTV